MIHGVVDVRLKRSAINTLESNMNYCKNDDMKWQDRMTMFAMAIVLLAAAAAIIGSGKKEVANDIEVFDIDSIIVDESGPLPEIVFEEAVLPEILPPLFDEPLPPLQGEV